MKKLSLFVLMLVIAIGVSAQGHFVIPTVGLNIGKAKLSGVDNPSLGYKNEMDEYTIVRGGFSGGVNYRYEFRKPYLIEAGIYFNQYGYYCRDAFKETTKVVWNWNYRQDNISVPVLFGYKFEMGKRNRFSITPKLGLQFGYIPYEKLQYSYLIWKTKTPTEYFVEGTPSNAFDVSELAAVEFGYNFNKILNLFFSVTQRFSFVNRGYDEKSVVYYYSFSTNLGLKIRVGR